MDRQADRQVDRMSTGKTEITIIEIITCVPKRCTGKYSDEVFPDTK